MDVARPFKAVFSDPEWFKKLILLGLIGLVPIVNFATYGYLLAYQRSVAEGRDERLPSWSEFGEHFRLGLYVIGATLVYMLPVFLIITIIIIGAIGVGAGGEDMVPFAVCGAIVLGLMVFVLAVGVSILFPGLQTHFNYHREFGAFFRIGETWERVKGAMGTYFGALGLMIVLSFAASMVTTPIIYLFQFAGAAPMMLAGQGGDDAAAFAGFCGMAIGQLVGYAIAMIAYAFVYAFMYHYLGQYMAIAYGMAGVAAPSAPAPVADVLPSPPAPPSPPREDLPPPPPPPNLPG